MQTKILTLLFFLMGQLHSETVEIVSDMYTEEVLPQPCFKALTQEFDVRITDQVHHGPITTEYAKIEKYLIFNIFYSIPELDACPV